VSKRCWSAFYSIFFRAFSSVRWQREGKGSTYQRVSTRSANRIAPCQSQWRIPRDRSLSWRSNPSVNGGFCLGATQRLSPPPFPPFSLSRSLSFPGQRKSGSGIHRSLGKSWPWIDINRGLVFFLSLAHYHRPTQKSGVVTSCDEGRSGPVVGTHIGR